MTTMTNMLDELDTAPETTAAEPALIEESDETPRGFAAMTPEQQRLIASQGGKAAHAKGTGHEFTREKAREAGRMGGETVSQDRAHMARIGRKGGETVSANREHMKEIGKKGGQAVSRQPGHMAEIGRKGGRVSSASR